MNARSIIAIVVMIVMYVNIVSGDMSHRIPAKSPATILTNPVAK